MSLNLLPRGVAARRAIVRDDSMESPASDQPEQMQVDAASPQSSSIELTQNQLPPRGQRTRRGQNQPPLESGQHPKSNVYQRKAPKPVKPRELCVLIETAMSNYALWTNADLRRYAADRNTNGYLSLSRLLSESPLIQATGRTIAEASVFQALKDYGTSFLELELKLTKAARNRQKAGSDSLYNIRRQDWESLRTKVDPDRLGASLWDRSEEAWNKRTIYVENIPRLHWSLPAALLFIHSCTQEPPSDRLNPQGGFDVEMETMVATQTWAIQNLELPPHAQASQGDVPVCKGFAFVTFTHVKDAQRFLTEWPWMGTGHNTAAGRPRRYGDEEVGDEEVGEQLMNLDLTKEKNEHEEAVKEGIESGLRSIGLEEWEGLKREYLTWQAELYEGMKPLDSGASRNNQSNSGSSPSMPTSHNGPERAREQPPHLPHAEERPEQRKATSAPHNNQAFPQGCLLFIKNLHPQTSKTTLKKLFEGALGSESSPINDGRGLDYVDWSKGMSSCHLRLSDPASAYSLARYFTTHSIIQTDGNDADGQLSSQAATLTSVIESGLKPLVAELVEGRAEEIYWDKVPHKIRMAALAKSSASMEEASRLAGQKGSEAEEKRTSEEPGNGARENKRRRKA